MKLIKVIQEIKGIAQITNRRPAPRPPLLYLMQLRAQISPSGAARRRVNVETAQLQAPAPIKINHIKAAKASRAVLAS